jgi:hypothetical protein
MRRYFLLVFFLSLVWLVSGCATKKLAPISEEDNPAHHYLMGMELIDKGKHKRGGFPLSTGTETGTGLPSGSCGSRPCGCLPNQGRK